MNEFYKEIETLKSNVQSLDDYEIQAQIAKIVASIGDSHTWVSLPVNLLLPLELYWFCDGIYVVSTSSEYNDMMHCRITTINGVSIDEVISALKPIVSYENDAFLKSQLTKYLPAIELLYGLEIVDEVDSLEVSFEDKNNDKKKLEVKSFELREAKEKLKSNINNIVSECRLPLYRKNNDKNYWFEYLQSFKTVYFKYKSCKDMISKSVSVFGKELIRFINENDIENVVIDMRNNSGGNSALLDPFIDNLANCGTVNKKGNLFVIVGRETFSSALLNVFSLKEKTNAIFLGEPTGGKPNCYGEVERFSLKNSGLIICYSTKYYKIIEDDNLPSFMPDINIELTIQNYIQNQDPCLGYILKTNL